MSAAAHPPKTWSGGTDLTVRLLACEYAAARLAARTRSSNIITNAWLRCAFHPLFERQLLGVINALLEGPWVDSSHVDDHLLGFNVATGHLDHFSAQGCFVKHCDWRNRQRVFARSSLLHSATSRRAWLPIAYMPDAGFVLLIVGYSSDWDVYRYSIADGTCYIWKRNYAGRLMDWNLETHRLYALQDGAVEICNEDGVLKSLTVCLDAISPGPMSSDVCDFCVTPHEDRMYVLCCHPLTLRVFTMAGKWVRTIAFPACRHCFQTHCLAWDPRKRCMLVTAGRYRAIYVVDVGTGVARRATIPHSSSINQKAYVAYMHVHSVTGHLAVRMWAERGIGISITVVLPPNYLHAQLSRSRPDPDSDSDLDCA